MANVNFNDLVSKSKYVPRQIFALFGGIALEPSPIGSNDSQLLRELNERLAVREVSLEAMASIIEFADSIEGLQTGLKLHEGVQARVDNVAREILPMSLSNGTRGVTISSHERYGAPIRRLWENVLRAVAELGLTRSFLKVLFIEPDPTHTTALSYWVCYLRPVEILPHSVGRDIDAPSDERTTYCRVRFTGSFRYNDPADQPYAEAQLARLNDSAVVDI